MIEVKDLHVNIEDKEILKGLNLKLEKGRVYVLMGPNGSGKSTLANTIVGNPKYEITSGEILFEDESIKGKAPDEIAKKGVFMSFQSPQEIPGVVIKNFLRQAYNTINNENLSIYKFKEILNENAKKLDLDEKFLDRYLNQGFSGGEKKKAEILQLITLNPKLAILDETDSGLDIDSLKAVSKGVNEFMNPEKTVLIITHYKRILDLIKPDKVFIIKNGKIVLEEDHNIIDELESKGYKWLEDD
jgi:Fe-S cluster assembly ATP-binding protein